MARRGGAKRRDKNEPEIVRALEAAGASVTQLDGEDGEPDLLIGYRGATYLQEVKDPISSTGKTTGGASRPVNGGDGILTAPQIKWHGAWRGAPIAIVTTPAEALAAIGAPAIASGPGTDGGKIDAGNGLFRGVADHRLPKIPRRRSRMVTTAEADAIAGAPDVAAACEAAHHQRRVGATMCVCGGVEYLTPSQVVQSKRC